MNVKLNKVKELASVELYVKDILWRFRVLSDKDYLFAHGDDSRGITEEELDGLYIEYGIRQLPPPTPEPEVEAQD